MQYHGASYAEDEWDVYWYEKNIFGDIVAVYNEAGTKLISYNYDAWGNFTASYYNGTTSSSIAARNPFRYRGYYYDADLGLYYLQTRYYDSVTGRFINADGYVSTGQGILGNNMFAYCNNNPVMFTDPTGEMSALAIVGIVVGVIAVAVAVAATANDIYQIVTSVGEATEAEAGDKLGYTVNGDGDVQIHNSYKVLTPWMQGGYSIYLNHFSEGAKGEIKGTSIGVQYEWMVHNIAYVFTGADNTKSANIGHTIFNDNHGALTVGMGITYVLFTGIIHSTVDAIIYACNK